MDNYITAPIGSCSALNHSVRNFCLPTKLPCDQTTRDGLFYPAEWNCNRPCNGDQVYFWPLPNTGSIMLQTRFNTMDTDEWGSEVTITLYDLEDNAITADYVNRWVVGSSKYGKYQTVEINLAQLANLTTCGYFVINYDSIDYTTQMFKIEPDCRCMVELEGIYTDLDCWNNYYGISTGPYTGDENFAYSNKIYVLGTAKDFGTSKQGAKVVENQRVWVAPAIPPYMMRQLSFVVLNAKTVEVNGSSFKPKDQTFTPREKTSMFAPIIDLYRDQCGGVEPCN